jgi:hypothetical protein
VVEALNGTLLEEDRFNMDGGAGSSSGFLSLKCGSVVVSSSGTSPLRHIHDRVEPPRAHADVRTARESERASGSRW